MKFKWKLFLSYLVIVLIPFLVAERYISSHLRDGLLQQMEDRLSRHALLLKGIIEREYPNRIPSYEMEALIKNLGEDLNERITFIDNQGNVLGDTDVPSQEVRAMEDHSRRPEFVQAFKTGYGMATRFSTTLNLEMMYVAVKVPSQGGFLGVVRVAVPLTAVNEIIRKTEYGLATAFLLCTLLILILNIFISRRLSRPVEEITRAAERISKGDFDVRARPGTGGELGLIGDSINLMALEIKKSVEEITQEKETLKTILRGMSDGVMVVDTEGRIILVNSVVENLVQGVPDVIGKTPVEVIRNAELQSGFSNVLEQGETFSTELMVPTPQADKIFDVTIVRLMPQIKIQGAVAVFHDITELKRVEKMRKDFVANVSHELRTPLTSIKGYAETLFSESIEDESKIKFFAHIILKHANRLSALVQDLLSLTRLESQAAHIVKSDVDLRKVLDASVLMVKPAAEAKHLRIETESIPEKTMVWADRDQLGQALINLLDNAVKYTPEGGSIRAFIKETESEIQVTIHDTGIGIGREHLNRIFERFYRVDKNRSREMGGTGLGLSIVRHIIQAHGGRVWVESEVEVGSLFSFSLPKKPDPDV